MENLEVFWDPFGKMASCKFVVCNLLPSFLLWRLMAPGCFCLMTFDQILPGCVVFSMMTLPPGFI